jgi:Family of unknown function (DUF6077)
MAMLVAKTASGHAPMRAIFTTVAGRLLTRPLESVSDCFFVFYSLWTLTWIVSYFANLSFSATTPIFFLLLPASVLALAFERTATDQRTPIAIRRARRDTLIVLIFVIAGVLLTLFLHRADSDDELYLGMAFSLLANADQPVQQLPGYGTGFDANGFSLISAYEPLKAMVSYITGLPLLDSYYLLVPALMSAVTVIVTYRLLRELIPEGWILGMLFFFVVMLTWGDVHRTLANFGFVRMFQGKSVFVSTVVPAIFLYFFLLRGKTRAWFHGFLLVAAVISGVGFSRGGLVIGPLLVLFLALASIRLDTLGRWPTRVVVLTAVSAVVIMLFVYRSGWTLMNTSHLVYTSRGDVVSTTNLEMVEFTMGLGIRAIILLVCVGASFLFVNEKELRYSYRNFLAIFFLLLLIPWTSEFFAKTLQEYLSWRWLWVTPVPVLASVAVGGALAGIRQVSNSAVALGVFLVLGVGFMAVSPRRVLSQENGASIRWPDAKLDGESVYLRPYQKKAAIKNGRLYLDGYENGF